MEAHPGMARTTDTFTLRCPRVGALGARVQIVIREIVEATIAEGLVPSPIRASLAGEPRWRSKQYVNASIADICTVRDGLPEVLLALDLQGRPPT